MDGLMEAVRIYLGVLAVFNELKQVGLLQSLHEHGLIFSHQIQGYRLNI